MKYALSLMLFGTILILGMLFTGCEQSVSEPSNGTIELTIAPLDINEGYYYHFTGTNDSDGTSFAVQSIPGSTLKGNSGHFLSPLLNTGNWVCNVYELTQQIGAQSDPTPYIVRQELGISVSVLEDQTTAVNVEWTS
ncbi:MAG: hypothetical protein AB7C91_09245 [Sphaerochaeta sp.]|jgi:hypothetical protein|uniref:hypothetical protein n=1 Tax=Sphaerochaeta sp. TaxID=1972642 RepID=UPI002FC7D7C1